MLKRAFKAKKQFCRFGAISLVFTAAIVWGLTGLAEPTAARAHGPIHDAITIPLQAQNNSGQTGQAAFTTVGDDLEVVLTLSQGARESKLAHIHFG